MSIIIPNNYIDREMIDKMSSIGIPLGSNRLWCELDPDALMDERLGDSTKTYREELYKVEEIGNETYILLGHNRYHTMYNDDGTVKEKIPSGNYQTLTKEESELWLEVFSNDIYTDEQIQEKRRIANMWETLEGAQELAIAQVNEYFDTLALNGFDSDCLGEIKHFDSDAKSVQQIMGQFSTALGRQLQKMVNPDITFTSLRWKESGITVCYEWTDEQIIALATSLQEATQELEHARELVIDVVENCNTIDEVKEALENLK